MNLTDWHKIKEQVYYHDGSWRDIYVLDTTHDDWNKWINLINQNYSVEFFSGQTAQSEATIDKNVVFDYFNGKTDLGNSATVTLGNIIVKCHFFSDEEIENDIDPREVDTVDDYDKLMSYLIDISKALNKTVILTAENEQDTIYVSVDGNSIKLKAK